MQFFERRQIRKETAALQKGHRKNAQLAERDQRSLPSAEGHLSIFVSKLVARHVTGGERYDIIANRIQEAERIKTYRGHRHGSVGILENPSKDLILDHLQERTVSDIVLIGPGTVDHFMPNLTERLDWRDVAKHARHLKTGNFDQLMDGDYAVRGHLCVPIGALVVCNVENMNVAVGMDRQYSADRGQASVLPPYSPHESLYQQIVSQSAGIPNRYNWHEL